MANRTVTVRYILDASGYRSGANDIASSDARIAASARASAAAMDQQQAKVERGQRKATQAFVAGGRAQEQAVGKVAKASAASVRIIEDAERRKVRIQQDAAVRVGRVQEDATRRAQKASTDAARQQIQDAAQIRAARIREDAATRASRVGVDAGVRAGRSAESEVASLQTRSAAYSQLGRQSLVTGGLIAAGLGLSARAAIQWQSDFTGVSKTVNGSTEELAGLEGQLRGLSRTMPQSSTQIAAVAESAGQLGIQTGSIAAFTKTMLQLGDTTNLSSDEAATSIAQLGNIMGTINGPAEQVNDTISRTGATIVGLGNDGASTEQQITQMGLRIASAGKTIGLNTPQVLGFASAIASTGVEVEAGGTGFSNFALKVDAAVRQGGSKLDTLAKTAGVSADEFRKAYGQDSAGALTSFIEGLGKAQARGEDTNTTLKRLGVTGIREADTIRRLALSGDLLARNLRNANTQYGANTALTNEAAKRYETDASRIQIAVNKIKDDAIDIGAATLPAISAITDQVGKYADAFKSLSPETQKGAVKTAGIAAGVLLVGGVALTAASSVATLAGNLKALGATKAGITGVAGALGAVTAGVVAAEAAGAIYDKFGSQKKQADNQNAVNASLLAYVDAAKKGQAASLDLSAAFPQPNQLNKFEGSIRSIMGVLPGGGILKYLTGDSTDVKNFNQALQFKNQTGFKGFLNDIQGMADKIRPGTQETERINDAVTKVDQGLATFVQNGNAKDAATLFQKITQDQGGDASKLVDQFSAYRDELVKVNAAAGVTNLTQNELADLMGGKIPPRVADAAKANTELANVVNSVTGKIQAQTKTLSEQLAVYQQSAAGILGVRSGQVGMESAIDQANAALKQNGKTLDTNTEKGRQNRTALDNIAASTLNYTKQLTDQKRSAVDIVEANERGRRAYIKQAEAFGTSAKKARSDAADLFKLPKEVRTQVAVDVKGASKSQIHDLNEDIQKLPKEQRAKIVTIAEDKGLKAARSALKEFDKPKTQKVKQEFTKAKAPKLGDLTQRVRREFDKANPPKVKDGVQKIKQVVSGPNDVGGALDSKKSRTITFNSKVNGPKAAPTPKGGTIRYKSEVTAPKPPKAPKGATINYKSKVEAPKAPKPPKGATITYKVKVDKTAKVPVPKGGTVRIKTDVDLSGVRRASSAVRGVKGKSVKINTTAGLGGVNAVRSAINSVHGKTVTITTVKREVTKKATGGLASGRVSGPGGPVGDKIPALLSDGEVVIKTKSAQRIGYDRLLYMNSTGEMPRFANGGIAGFAKGGKITIQQLLNAITDDNPLKDVEDAKKGSKAWKEALKEAAKAVRDFGNTLRKQYTSSSTSGQDQLALQQQGIADLKGLQDKIDQLQALGLSDDQIKAIVERASEGDVAGASALADSIIQGGKGLVDQLNAATQQLANIANFLAADTQTKKTKGLATGGQALGPGTATSDTAGLFALSNREWVHPVAAVDYYGEAFMAAVQNRTLPKSHVSGYMAGGGQVGVKVVQAPSNTGDIVRAMEGMTVQVQNPWTGQYMDAHMRVVADQQIGSALTSAAGSR